ncbi:MAG: TetR/AcrR family transcriptional regulator, partial [Burkholderiales bacterium]|nr:TetR/AcrR family transcriptional regulator [Burkholderiales bacterium]
EAMRLTALRGYNGVTSKEICEASGVNTALVSYYFGSRKQLHQEILRRAHDQLFSMEDILRIFELPLSPEEKLKEFLSHVFRREKNSATVQAVKIFFWELRFQSDALEPTLQTTVIPKLSILLQLGSQISGLPPDSIELRRTMFLVMAPCIIAVMFPPIILETLFNFGNTNSESFVDFILKTALKTLKNAKVKEHEKKAEEANKEVEEIVERLSSSLPY